MIRVGLCTIAFREMLLEDVLCVAQRCGVDGVELWGREPHICEHFNRERVEAEARLIASRGLEVSMFGSYVRLGVPREHGRGRLSAAESAVRTAQCLGAPLVRVWAGDCPSAQATAKLWKACLADLKRMAEIAARHGVALAIEMHDNTLADTGETTRRLIEDCGAENVFANYQPSFAPEADDPLERLEAVVDKVANVHAQNMDERVVDGVARMVRVPIAEGRVNYEAVVERLKSAGFNGYVEVEFVAPGALPKEEMAVRDVDFLRSIAR